MDIPRCQIKRPPTCRLTDEGLEGWEGWEGWEIVSPQKAFHVKKGLFVNQTALNGE